VKPLHYTIYHDDGVFSLLNCGAPGEVATGIPDEETAKLFALAKITEWERDRAVALLKEYPTGKVTVKQSVAWQLKRHLFLKENGYIKPDAGEGGEDE